MIVLDANCANVGGCGVDSKQGKWLAADLVAHPAFCTMAIWHQPRFSSGDEHGNDPSVGPFWDALHAAGADVIVNGHDHDYERFAPQDPEGRIDRQRSCNVTCLLACNCWCIAPKSGIGRMVRGSQPGVVGNSNSSSRRSSQSAASG